MYETIRNSSIRVKWQLREVHLVTQWKGGCVYKTRSLGIICCTPEYAHSLRVDNPNIQVGSISTRVSRLLNA